MYTGLYSEEAPPMAGHHRPLPVSDDLREAVAAAKAFAVQTGVAVDVWWRHRPPGFKVADVSEYDRWAANNLRHCYRIDGDGRVSPGPRAPAFEELFPAGEVNTHATHQ